MKDFKRLEDYGIIGNLDTCALVGNDGSIDWCCFPHMESPSVFASILDIKKGGHFAISPCSAYEPEQRYIRGTNVLETIFKAASGVVTITDFMPVKEGGEDREKGTNQQIIFRKITCNEGRVELKVEFKPRFNYALSRTAVESADGGLVARGNNNDTLYLYTTLELDTNDDSAKGVVSLKAGDTFWMAVKYGQGLDPESIDYNNALDKTIQFWRNWVHRCEPSKCVFSGPWHDLIARSGLILKLLTHRETGAICAAATTSLPEVIGGVRNWDYRYNWIRDAAFTVQALFNLGHIEEARNHLRWFMNICKQTKEPSEIQIMYGMHGERELEEVELTHLSGYRNSRPVRVGNGAAKQRQLDIYGELINAIYETNRYGEDISSDIWVLVQRVVDYVSSIWDTKDAGIWEIRGGPRHFVYSKLMCWVAIDRGIKIAKLKGFEAPLAKWAKLKGEIRDAIIEKGFNRRLNSFVQAFDSETLDATSLLIPILGFLPFDDRMVQGTIDATLKGLVSRDGLVYRYQGEDGLSGTEGAFLLCSFWLVNVLALSGRGNDAEKIFKNILRYANPIGLLSEEVDPDTGEQIGNIPQAFSHIGLINSALYLGRMKGRKQMGPEPLGEESNEKT